MKILNKLELMSPSIKVGGSNGYVVELPENAGALLTEESTNSLISTAKTEAISESKNYTDQKVSSVYRVKGSVPSIEDLPEDAEVGDVYNISDDLGGHNYVKTENGWDKLGGTVDLSPYALKTDVSGCVEDLEDKITAAQNAAVSTSNDYTDACIVAANLSQYAKTEDVYTKGEVDDGFLKARTDDTVKIVDDHVHFTGSTYFHQTDGSRELVIGVPVTIDSSDGGSLTAYGHTQLQDETTISGTTTISGDTTVIAPVEFTDSVSFSQTPTINSKNVATTDQIPDAYTKTEADSTFVKIGDATTGDVDADKVEAENIEACGLTVHCGQFGYLEVCGEEVATKKYVDDSLCSYLPATHCQCGNFDHYVVTETLFYGESEVATINDILPVTKGDQTTPIYSNSNACLEVYGIIANGGMTVCGKPVATVSYVDQAETDANKYTDDCVAALNIGDYAKKTEVSGCLTALEGCVDAVEAKIPTDYLPAISCTCAINGQVFYCVEECVDFTGGISICGGVVATAHSVCVVFEEVESIRCAINNLQYLPAAQECGIGPYIVNAPVKFTETLIYGESEIATVADIPTDYFPATKINNNNYDASSTGLTLFGLTVVCGVILPVNTRVGGEFVATKPYVDQVADQAEIDAFCAAQAYTDEKIASLGSVLEYKGNKTYAELPTEGNDVGDVYNITADYAEKGIKAGDNVVWNGSDWDVLSGPIDLSGYYDKSEVDDKLDNKLTIRTGGGWDMVDSCVMFLYGVQFNTPYCPEIISCTGGVLLPTEDTHIVVKKYVDDLVSTSISVANSNIVYDEDFVLGDGTFDSSASQMKWTVSPEGATKILSVIALDGEGNLVHPSYKWANNTLTVSIFAESEQDNPGYTVTVSYKK